jgi:hypothetical protein
LSILSEDSGFIIKGYFDEILLTIKDSEADRTKEQYKLKMILKKKDLEFFAVLFDTYA